MFACVQLHMYLSLQCPHLSYGFVAPFPLGLRGAIDAELAINLLLDLQDKMAEIMQLLDKLQDDNAALKNMNGILVAQLSDCQSRLHHLERHAAAIDGHCQWEPLCIQLALYCTRTPRHIEPCSTSSTESESECSGYGSLIAIYLSVSS